MQTQTFSGREVAAVIAIAAISGCIAALQPLLLGALLSEGRITAGAMGYAATVEGLATMLATVVAGAWLKPRRLRWIATVAIVAVLAANLITLVVPPDVIVLARGLSGAGNGILLWIFISMAARSELPARLFAGFLTANATVVFLLSLLLGTFAISRFGATAGYAILICVYLLLLGTVRFLPDDFMDLDTSGGAARPPIAGLVALCAVGLFLAGITAFWIFAVALGTQAGISTRSMQLIISIATGVQIVAGLAGIALASKVTGMQALVGATLICVAAVAATIVSDNVWIWGAATIAISFCWMFAPSFNIGFLDLADPSRRAAIFVGSAQLAGLAMGPALAR